MSFLTATRSVSRLSFLAAALALTMLLSACGQPAAKEPAQNTPASSPQTQTKSSAPAKPNYPTKPVKLIITHAAGGTTDLAARIVAPHLEKHLGQPVVAENMTGAGGNVARDFVWKAAPDGYTLLVSQMPSMDGGKVASGGDFEPMKFTHVYNLAGNNHDVVAVPASSPIKSLKELVEASAKKPLSSSGSGVGTNSFMAAVLLQQKVGVKLTYVPFNSGREAATAVAGKQVEMGTGALDSFLPLHEQGLVRILAVFGDKRDAHAKDIPTVIELGYKDVWLDQMTGVFAPPGTPKEIVDVLATAFEKALNEADLKAAADKAKVTMVPLGPTEFEKAHKQLSDMVLGMADQIKSAASK